MTIVYHRDLIQGSEEWHNARLGLLTGSEVKLVMTPTLAVAKNDKSRAHLSELVAQRISNYVEPTFLGWDMERGHADEARARIAYEAHYGPLDDGGFVTNDQWGFVLGCSPDGLASDDGGWECKSRKQKFQVDTIIAREMPAEFAFQVQTSLLVTQRQWWDFTSYSGGLPMITLRVWPDEKIQTAILETVADAETRMAAMVEQYNATLASEVRLIPTERHIEQEMFSS
jgi:hypothetical protein